MTTQVLTHKFKQLSLCLFFPILYLLYFSVSVKGVPSNPGNKRNIQSDTIPGAVLSDIKQVTWNRMHAANGVLIAMLDNGDSMIISRNGYEKYARERVESNDYDAVFTKVEIEPEYPGGPDAWSQYIKKNIRYSQEAIKNSIQDTVFVQFIVELDGSLKEVEAVSGSTSGELRYEAMRLVKMSSKWNTAIQNFRIVRAYKKQAVIFMPEKNR